MNGIDKLIRRMRRLWVLEHSARWVLLLAAAAVNVALLGLLLHRLADLPAAAVAGGALAVLAAIVPVAILVRLRSPADGDLAQLLDRRAGTNDLFASARSFNADADRFGPLGELTCDLARSRSRQIALRPRWSLGSRRQWLAQAGLVVVLGVACLIAAGHDRAPADDGDQIVVAPPVDNRPPAPAPTTDKERAEPPAAVDPAPMEMIDDTPQPEETVKITDEMIQKYLAEAPTDFDVDLTGVTPIRWDDDEIAGKDDPSKRDENEKIDPVKLDAALLKDLEQAKKTKDESGAESKGGVDVAVMSKDPGAKVKGKQGGKKKSDADLANATSKDPRGNPTRLAVKPSRKGMQVISAARAPSTQKGKDRPMKLLDFLAAVRSSRARPADKPLADDVAAARSDDRPVRAEGIPDDAAETARSYFEKLRKADP